MIIFHPLLVVGSTLELHSQPHYISEGVPRWTFLPKFFMRYTIIYHLDRDTFKLGFALQPQHNTLGNIVDIQKGLNTHTTLLLEANRHLPMGKCTPIENLPTNIISVAVKHASLIVASQRPSADLCQANTRSCHGAPCGDPALLSRACGPYACPYLY